MVRPSHSMDEFRYDLPETRIARYPLPNRDESNLLVYREGIIAEHQFLSIPNHLPDHDLLVINNTKVIRARLIFYKQSGARIEVMLLEPIQPVDYQLSFSALTSCIWSCLIGNQKKWKGEILRSESQETGILVTIMAEIVESATTQPYVRFTWEPDDWSFGQVIEHFGNVPIPPYLNRPSEEIDKTRYQTVYAHYEGSVAAPTAGLHFTQSIIKYLNDKPIQLEELTLHVGFGTFMPVKSANISTHQMHAEKVVVHRCLLEAMLNRSPQGVTAVGTTSMRSLESLFWLGLMVHHDPTLNPLHLTVNQWYPYDQPADLTPIDSLQQLMGYMDRHQLDSLEFRTEILIAPGYTFKFVERLITNFHQPSSTLLLLIASFIGSDWRKVYHHALDHGFRFLSYGDSSLLYRNH